MDYLQYSGISTCNFRISTLQHSVLLSYNKQLSTLNIKIKTSIVGVIDNKPEQKEFDSLKVNVQILVNELLNQDKPWLIQEGRYSHIVVRFKWKEGDSNYCVLCMEADSSMWAFSNADYLFLETAWRIVKSSLEQYSRKNVFRFFQDSAIIVSSGQAVNQGGGANDKENKV
ncbi:hypothetical protein [Desulfitobacterium hafniense]|nr:hypothetical protein [Desulfitobacterium hafniense]